MPEQQEPDYGIEEVRYLCRIIDDGHFGIDLKWKTVAGVIGNTLGMDMERVSALLDESNIGFSGNLDENFLVVGVFDASVDEETRHHMFGKLVEGVASRDLLKNLTFLLTTGYGFTLATLEFILQDREHIPDDLKDNPYLSIATCDFFIESKAVREFVSELIPDMGLDLERIRSLVGNYWFINLLLVLKSGIPMNESRGLQKLMDSNTKIVDRVKILDLIRDGTLATMVLNRNLLMKQDFVQNAFNKRYEMEQHEKNLKRTYYWLGIANDFILGVLFLIGSFEFLPSSIYPGASEVFGVVLFIIGSAQLVGRSGIQIAMNLHIRRHIRKKLREIISDAAR